MFASGFRKIFEKIFYQVLFVHQHLFNMIILPRIKIFKGILRFCQKKKLTRKILVTQFCAKCQHFYSKQNHVLFLCLQKIFVSK